MGVEFSVNQSANTALVDITLLRSSSLSYQKDVPVESGSWFTNIATGFYGF